MATLVIPTFSGVYAYGYPLILEGRRFNIRFRWNPEDVPAGSWSMDWRDDAGRPLILGLKLSLGRNKLRRYKYRRVPQGSLDVVDTSREDNEAGADDLGSRVLLLYVEAG